MLTSMLLGLLFAVLFGRPLYVNLVNDWPRSLLIGLLFSLLTFFLSVLAAIFGNLSPVFAGHLLTSGKHPAMQALSIAALSVVVLLVAALFQWIYSLSPILRLSEPTAFVFLIDDSSSMYGNDRQNARYAAIESVLEKQSDDFPFMISSFTGEADALRDMGPSADIHAEIAALTRDGYGGTTDIPTALNQAITDYENGVWQGGAVPKVILLSDGDSYWNNLDDILNRYNQAGVSVSAVGFGSANKGKMTEIAERTGGIYVYANNVSDLRDAMTKASVSVASRDLISVRRPVASSLANIGLGFLRILFLSVLGLLISLAAVMAYGDASGDFWICVLTSTIPSALGAIAMEYCTSTLHISDSVMSVILWVLLSALVVWHITLRRNNGTWYPGDWKDNNRKASGGTPGQAPKTNNAQRRGKGF